MVSEIDFFRNIKNLRVQTNKNLVIIQIDQQPTELQSVDDD